MEGAGGCALCLNGKVERPNDAVFGGMHAMLTSHQAPPQDWCEAGSHFPKAYNMTLHRAINDAPFNRWCGRKPLVVPVWKAGAYVVDPVKKKLDPRVKPSELLGFVSSTRLIHCRDAATGYVKETPNAHFDKQGAHAKSGDLTIGLKLLQG